MKTENKEQIKNALQAVLDYRQGNGKFNLSHIKDANERANAAHDLWLEVEADIRDALDTINKL